MVTAFTAHPDSHLHDRLRRARERLRDAEASGQPAVILNRLADDVIASRVALYAELVREGARVSETTVRQLAVDRLLLNQHGDA